MRDLYARMAHDPTSGAFANYTRNAHITTTLLQVFHVEHPPLTRYHGPV
jgi:hypothetical protein